MLAESVGDGDNLTNRNASAENMGGGGGVFWHVGEAVAFHFNLEGFCGVGLISEGICKIKICCSLTTTTE